MMFGRPVPPAEVTIALFTSTKEPLHEVVTDADLDRAKPRRYGVLDAEFVRSESWAALLETCDGAAVDFTRPLLVIELRNNALDERIGVAILPRPTARWAHVPWDELRLYPVHGKSWADLMGYDAWCEMRYMLIGGLVGSLTPIVERPRPAFTIDTLRKRYHALEITAEDRSNILHELSTWDAFLHNGCSAAQSLHRMRAARTPVQDLACEAWPKIDDPAP